MAALSMGSSGVIFLNSCSSLPTAEVAPLEIPGAHCVGDHVCFECHTNIVRKFEASPHARLRLENADLQDNTGCESCHGPGSKHAEAGGGIGKFIINPGQVPEACLRCHLATRAEFQLPVHHPVVEGHMNCVQCHDPHGEDIFKPEGDWPWRDRMKPVLNATASRHVPSSSSIRPCAKAAPPVTIRTARSTA